MLSGFLLVFLIDRLTHSHAETTVKHRLWVANLTLIGLSIHALADGFNLVVAVKEPELGTGLAVAILAHRLPVAIALTFAFLRNGSFLSALGRLTPLMIAPLIGAFIGEKLLSGPFGEFTEYLTAFAAGTLLHVLIDDFRIPHTPSPTRSARMTVGIGFVMGLAVVLLADQNLHLPHIHSH